MYPCAQHHLCRIYLCSTFQVRTLTANIFIIFRTSNDENTKNWNLLFYNSTVVIRSVTLQPPISSNSNRPLGCKKPFWMVIKDGIQARKYCNTFIYQKYVFSIHQTAQGTVWTDTVLLHKHKQSRRQRHVGCYNLQLAVKYCTSTAACKIHGLTMDLPSQQPKCPQKRCREGQKKKKCQPVPTSPSALQIIVNKRILVLEDLTFSFFFFSFLWEEGSSKIF